MSKVLVISMEKAGSTTVMHAIRSAGFEVGRVHRHNINKVNPDDYSHFVAMVREPVAKSISNHFETDKVVDIKEEVEFTLNFFDSCVRSVCGFDVMKDHYFDRRRGWEIYNRNLLVIRTEDFNWQLTQALTRLFNPFFPIEIIHHPVGFKRFGPEYVRFVEEIKFDRDYLKEVYKSRYCRKFGYDEVERWAK